MKKAIIVVLFIIYPSPAFGALLYFEAANQDTYAGQTFALNWYLDTEGQSINTLHLKLDFSKEVLEAIEATTANSLVSLWIKYPSIDNEQGEIEMIGGIPNGINGSKVPLFRTVFKAKNTGQAQVSLNPDSSILKNDGAGGEELLKFKNLLFNIYPQEFIPNMITSRTHPDQNIWYANKDVSVEFSPKLNEHYSYSFSSNTEITPDEQIDPLKLPFEALKYSINEDGVYYFKLNSKIGDSVWREAGIYRIQIDRTPPESFTPLLSNQGMDGSTMYLSFSTVDKMSGISHYYIKSGLWGQWKKASSPYHISKPIVGKHIKVAAVDNAGNKRIETIEYKGYLQVWVFVCLMVVFLSALGYSAWRFLKK